MPIIKCLSYPRIDSYSIYLHTIHGKYSRYLSLFDSLSSVVFCIPHAAECKIKTCFLDSAACRPQKQNLFSGLRSVQSLKSEFVFGFCTLRNAKTELVFRVCTLHGAKTKSVFGLCTLRSGHSKLVFYTLHTAERKISICFCILQRNES